MGKSKKIAKRQAGKHFKFVFSTVFLLGPFPVMMCETNLQLEKENKKIHY